MLLTCNVSTGSCWTDYVDTVTNLVTHLEITVDEVTNLNKNSGPVDAVDRAKIVFGNIFRLSKDSFYRNIQII